MSHEYPNHYENPKAKDMAKHQSCLELNRGHDEKATGGNLVDSVT